MVLPIYIHAQPYVLSPIASRTRCAIITVGEFVPLAAANASRAQATVSPRHHCEQLQGIIVAPTIARNSCANNRSGQSVPKPRRLRLFIFGPDAPRSCCRRSAPAIDPAKPPRNRADYRRGRPKTLPDPTKQIGRRRSQSCQSDASHGGGGDNRGSGDGGCQ